MISDRALQLLKAMGLGTILVSNIFLFGPFTLYLGNLDEFAASFPTILSLYFRPTIFLIAAFGLVGMLLTTSIFRRYLVLLATVSLLLWLQGNILVWDYGLMDGRGINWMEETWRGWVDLAIWFSAILIAMFFRRRIEKPVIYAAVATFSLQLIIFLSTGIQSAPTLLKKSETKPSARALPEIYRFSSHKNVLHIILDGFQSDVFEEIISDGEDGKRFTSALDGFVFFKEHMGVFPYTHMSVPTILSGKIYRNHIPSNEFLSKTIGGKTILSAAHDAGYEIDLATAGGWLYNTYTKSPHTNAYLISDNHHVTESEYELADSAKLLDLALFRLTPHFLKKYVYNDQLWLVRSLVSDSKFMRLQFFSHSAFLRKLTENMSADRSTAVYKLFHLMLVHNPMVVNESCEYAGRVLPTVRETVKIHAKCSLSEVVKLLEKMKQLNIYDDAMIVLMADHGAWVPPAGLTGYIRADGRTVAMNPTTVAMALPLMAIKRPGASGALHISMAPSSIVDIPATIASVLTLDEEFDGHSAFDLLPDELRERRHYSYQYRRSEWTADYLSPIQEFIVKGSVFDSAAWRLGDKFLPNGVVNER